MLLPLLFALLSPSAHAGEIIVSAPITTTVYLDGMSVDFDNGVGRAVARNLQGGSYQVEVRNAFGKLKAQLLVELGPEEAVSLSYDRKQLIETGRGAVRAGTQTTVEGQLDGVFGAIERTAEDVAEEIEAGTQPVGEAARDAADEVEQAAEDAVEEVEEAVEPD